MSDPWPDADTVAALFERARGGEPSAVRNFVTAVLEPLADYLRRRYRGADEHACLTAAEDAVLDLLHDPTLYDPTRRGLIGFLCMSAEGDLLNALEKEARHYRDRESGDSVELAPDRRKSSVEAIGDELLSFDDPRFATEIACFDATERAAFDAMCAGVRATAVYASILGIDRLPEDEQRRAVKRAKERIFKRLQRAREKS